MSDRCQTYVIHRPERPPGAGARGGPAGQAAGDAPQTPAARPSAARGPRVLRLRRATGQASGGTASPADPGWRRAAGDAPVLT